MSDSAQPFTSVRINFRPYDRQAVQTLLRKINQEFRQQHRNQRWYWTVADVEADDNVWIIDFHFSDPNDAIIFSLKYQR